MADFSKILTKRGVNAIFQALAGAGGEAFVVGGAVRDSLLAVPIGDIDFATNLDPHDVEAACQKHNIKTIPTGLQHGTVTALVYGQSFEITSYRIDEETDGRHARVTIGGTQLTDAARRDFTINALYLGQDGTCHDPLGEGIDDIRARRLRFIGDAAGRIQEDYLRILRYFRFLATCELSTIESDVVAITAHRGGLAQISAERIGQEMRKLLLGDYAEKSLALMAVTGVTSDVGLLDLVGFSTYLKFESAHKLQPDFLLRCAALMKVVPRKEWRLTNNETMALKRLEDPPNYATPAIYGYRYGEDMGARVYLRRCYLDDKRPVTDWRAQTALGAKQVFPIDGNDIIETGRHGVEIGVAKTQLETHWIDSGFQLDRAALLAMLD